MGKKILIADDLTLDIVLSRSVVDKCEQISDVDVACDGAEALTLLIRNQYDLVLLDIKMPKIDGFELLQLLREHHPDSTPLVFILSGSDSMVDRERANALGVEEYVQKSLEYAKFRADLREALARHGFC
jgi:CheY-like chemotaxis protein